MEDKKENAENQSKGLLQEKLVTKVGKLLSEKQKKVSGYSRAYEYVPADFFEKQHGTLYFVIEIASPNPTAGEIGEMIIGVIKEEYYADLDRDVLVSFESALKAVNKELANLAAQGKTSWLNKINAICASLSDGNLHLTQVGSAEAYLLRNEQLTHISENLFTPSQKHDPLKTFVNIASGTLEPEDRLIISTPGLFYSMSLDTIKRAIADQSPTQAVKKLAEDLKEEEDALGTSLLVIRAVTEDKISKEEVLEEDEEIWIAEPKGKLESISEKTKPIISRGKAALSNGLKKASKTGKKTVLPFFSKISMSIKGRLGSQKIESTSVSEPVSHKEMEKEKAVSEAKAAPLEKKKEEISTSPKDQTGSLEEKKIPLASEKHHILEKPLHTTEAQEKKPAPKISKSKKLFKKTGHTVGSFFSDVRAGKSQSLDRYLYLGLLIASIIFLSSLGIFFYKRAANRELQRVESIYNTAFDQEQQAEAALIYKDRQRAKDLLKAASSSLKTIENNKTYKQKVANLESKINEELDKADLVYRIKNPQVVADFGADSKASFLSLIGTDFYSFQTDSTSVYQYNGNDKKVTKVNKSLTPGKFLSAAQTSDNTLLIYDNGPGLSEYDPTSNSITPQTIALNGTWEKGLSIASYQNYLYVLSPTENKIYRHAKTLGGFSIGVDYLANTNINLSKAVSMTISETVFVLNSDGTILQFTKGSQVPFQVKNVPFALESPTIIYTHSGFNNIYICDSKKKAVIVLDNTGAYKGNYVSDSFGNIKGITVDEAGKKLYILSDNKVYSVALQE
jgi:hypothetical protein